MTTTNHTPTPTPADAAPQGGTDAPADAAALRAEAARRRHQLRDAEAERDALAAEVTTTRDQLQTWKAREVRQITAEVVASPETLETLGYNPADYIGDDLTVDADAARRAAEELREAHGLAPAESGPSSLAREVAAELPEHKQTVPADLLRGGTAAELREHRDQIRAWVAEQFPVMPVVAGESAGGGPLPDADWLRGMMHDR